jgi:cytochrome P450
MYDPFSEQCRDDPYPVYAALRDQCPAYLNREQSFWALSREADVSAALRDWRTFSSAQGVSRGGDLMDMDPPEHDRIRRPLARRLRPAAAERLEQLVRESAGELLEQADTAELDMSRDFAQRLPALVMCRVLGISETETPVASELARELIWPGGGEGSATARMRARSALAELFLARVAGRSRRGHTEDLIGDLAAALSGGAISRRDVPGLCLMFLVAGVEPTACLLTNIIHSLAASRVKRAEVRDGDGRVRPATISEFLRHDAPVQWVSRVTTRDVQIHSRVIPEGHRVMLLIGSANRDPRRYERPDEFDPDRGDGHGASFGYGVHACLGVALTRMQARAALEVVLDRLPTLALAGPARRSPSHVLRGFDRLPVAAG